MKKVHGDNKNIMFMKLKLLEIERLVSEQKYDLATKISKLKEIE